MALPLTYNFRNVFVRWRATLATILGIGMVVAHEGEAANHFGALGHASYAIGATLVAAGLTLHTAPRVTRAIRGSAARSPRARGR